jgi:dethiobiotin synthetase
VAAALFVTGTDTGVGKSVLAAALLAALRVRGVAVRALKPVITGLHEPTDLDWPPDHELLGLAAGCSAAEVIVAGYGPPVSPHLAAELAQRPVDLDAVIATARGLAADPDAEVVILEGVGGLLVPLSDRFDVRRLAVELDWPLLVSARPGLGTINHTLLTLEVARAAGLRVAAVVLTPWPASPDRIERSNLETIERLGQVPVATLPHIGHVSVAALGEAGALLPLEEWIPSLPRGARQRAIPTAARATLQPCAAQKIS